MSNIGLNTGLKALLTAQASLDTVGHNVANANTPGYSRQRLQVSAAGSLRQRGLLIGAGVNPDVVSRATDVLLMVRTTGQIASLNRLESALGGMTEIEALLGEPGSFGLSSGMSNFFTAVSELSTSTEDLVLRTGLVQMSTAMTTQFNQLSSTMSSMRIDTAGQIGLQVNEVNALSEQIVTLNVEIAQTEASGYTANDLRDKREQTMRELASYVDVSFHEDKNGVVRITTAGRLLVGGTKAFKMSSESEGNGSVEVFLEGSKVAVNLKGGKLAGLMRVSQDYIPGLQGDFDKLARNFIFEMNRVHSTGTPASGSYKSLTSAYSVHDSDLDGLATDELLANSGLPFDLSSGDLYVNVTRLDSGDLVNHKVSIDANTTTVGEFIDDLNAIAGINANLNSFGRLQVFSDAGFGFDFAARLDTSPDTSGTFGGGLASIGAGLEGPYALADGDTLDLVGAVGPFSVTLDAADFTEMSEATADELAAVLNADPDVQANGLRAVVTDGRLFLQTEATGSSYGFTVAGGSALAALGLSAGHSTVGSDTNVDIEIGGAYSGEVNDSFTFVPKGDGIIGTTPGLEVDVFSQTGQLVATLDLGPGYQPGTAIHVDKGITAAFNFGELSATDNDLARVELISDSDTTDVLAAVGLNALFIGTGAEDIGVREDLEVNPLLIAAGATGAAGDNQTLLGLLDLQSRAVEGLDGDALGDFYGDVVSGVGFDISTTASTLEVEEFLLSNLESRREQTSGVNVDEELVDMVRFEQSFAAASRYIQVLNELSAEILNLI